MGAIAGSFRALQKRKPDNDAKAAKYPQSGNTFSLVKRDLQTKGDGVMSSRKFLLGIGLAAFFGFGLLASAPAQAGWLGNIGHDLGCACFGPNNEIAKALQPVVKFEGNITHDITHGPGPHNDLVGRKGWVRQRLGF